MAIRIAINGFGRIGRNVLRALYELHDLQDIQIIAINELAEPKGIAHLLKYDTSHGRFDYPVSLSLVSNTSTFPSEFLDFSQLDVASDSILLLSEECIDNLPWDALDIDVVLDCTGVFGTLEHGKKHVDAGAKKVLFSQPGGSDLDATVIYGINHQQLTEDMSVVSNGSCTTNCIVPVIAALDEAFGIESGTITTIHASMHDQQVIDAYHKDLRRTRAASQSIIPVDTALARGVERILPKFAGRFEAIAVRVPTINVTAMDLSVTLHSDVDIDTVNRVLRDAGQGVLEGVLGYTEEPLVSVDFNHDSHSAVVDGTQTRVSHKRLVKTLVWCDNEWGFANRMLDTAKALMNCKIS